MMEYSHDSVLLVPPQTKNKITDFTRGKDCDGTLGSLMTWVHGKYQDRPCLGARKVMWVKEGKAFGKPIKIVSQSPTYDRLSHSEIQEKVESIATGMRVNCNVEKGSKVFIFAKTRMEWIISALACWKAGAVVSTFYTTSQDNDIEFVLKQTMPKLIITEEEFMGKLNKMTENIGLNDNVQMVSMDTKQNSRAIHLSALEKAGSEVLESTLPQLTKDDLALLIYTSGTNGLPKGVIFTHEQVVCGITETSQYIGHQLGRHECDVGESHLVYLPLAHIFQLSAALATLAMGMCLDFGSPFTLADSSPSVVPGERGDLVVSSPVIIPMVPLLAKRIKAGIEKKVVQRGKSFQSLFKFCLEYKSAWMRKGYNTPILNMVLFDRMKRKLFGANLNCIGCGGSAMSKDVLNFLRTICFPECYVGQGYGATEIMAGGMSQIRFCPLADSIGHTGPNTLVMIKSWQEKGYTIQDEEGPSGELLIGGAHVAQGYLCQDSDGKDESFFTDQNGRRWFRTGDVARLNPLTNSVSIIDRKKQLIKLLNGKYISLAKIEQAMAKLEWIDTACVVTRSDKQQLAAVVVPDWSILEKVKVALDDDKMVTPGNFEKGLVGRMLDALDGELARHEIPRVLHLAQGPWTPDTGLVTSTMKIKRKAIQEEYELQISDMLKQIE